MNKKKYTIAQILPALNTGGVERGVVEISKALVDNNFRSIVVSSGGYMVPQITRTGGIHYHLDVHTKNPLKWPKIRSELKRITFFYLLFLVQYHPYSWSLFLKYFLSNPHN